MGVSEVGCGVMLSCAMGCEPAQVLSLQSRQAQLHTCPEPVCMCMSQYDGSCRCYICAVQRTQENIEAAAASGAC